MRKIKAIFKNMKANENKGQVILILVLITVVGLIIGLSLISRSITDVRMASQVEQSNKAFSAAEAGIESALRQGTINQQINLSLPGATANCNIELVGNSDTYIIPSCAADTSQTVWLVDHDSDGNIIKSNILPNTQTFDICWGLHASSTPSVIVTLLYFDGVSNSYKIIKQAYGTNAANNFKLPDGPGSYCNFGFQYRTNFDPSSFGVNNNANTIILALRLQPLGSLTDLAVQLINPPPGILIPKQGKRYVCLGSTDTKVMRKIQVIERFQSLPAMFDYPLFVETKI